MERLGREIGAKTLMHGTDDPDDVARLRESGVNLGQGPAVGPPLRQAPASGDESSGSSPSSASPPSRLQEIAETTPCLPASEPLSAIVDLSLDDADHDWLVLIDAGARPVKLVERAALLQGKPFERKVEIVGPDMPLRLAAKKALARPRPDRSRPLAVCDADGRYWGLLRIERLLEALAA